jgi:CBS domain-containing protein
MLADGFELAPAFLEGIKERHRKVKTVMAKTVTTVTEDTPARDIVRLMCAKNIKRVPVALVQETVGIDGRLVRVG